MNTLRKLRISIASSFDGLISQIENHEALVTCTIKEMATANARAKARLHSIQRDTEALKKRQGDLTASAAIWAERAMANHAEDRATALECIRRKQQTETEIGTVGQRLAANANAEQQLNADIQLVEGRIEELKHKRQLLAAREQLAQALVTSQTSGEGLVGDVDDVLGRWELKLDEKEAYRPAQDTFESGFVKAEQDEELNRLLDEMIKKKN